MKNLTVKQVGVIALILILLITYSPSAFADEFSYKPKTVLYNDGTLILNVAEEDYDNNLSQHNGVNTEYPSYDGNNYKFTAQKELPWYESADNIISVKFGSDVSPEYAAYWFSGLKNLESIDFKNFSTDALQDFSYAFYGSGNELSSIAEQQVLYVSDTCKIDNCLDNSQLNIRIMFNETTDIEEDTTEEAPSISEEVQAENNVPLTEGNDSQESSEKNKVNYSIVNNKTDLKQNKATSAADNKNASTYANDRVTISMPGVTYSYGPNGENSKPNMHGYFKADGGDYGAAYCGEHDIASPVAKGDKKTFTPTKYNENNVIRKILYYGYRGPKPWSGFSNSKYNSPYQLFSGNYASSKTQACGNAVTAMALTKAYKDAGPGRGMWWNVSGLTAFREYINGQPAPPPSFVVYKIDGGSSQDLFTWTHDPYGYLQIKKESAESDSKEINDLPKKFPDRCNVSEATFDVYSTNSDHNKNIKKVGTLVSDKSGKTKSLKLQPGYYRWHEVKPAVGHSHNPDTYWWCRVDDGETEVRVVKNVIRRVRVNVQKEKSDSDFWIDWAKRYPDSKYDRTLKGAKFNVYATRTDAEKNVNVIASITTDSKGKGDVLLPLRNEEGYYYVKEVKAAPGYEINDTVYGHKFSAGEAFTFKVTEPYSSIWLKVIKQKGPDPENVTSVYKDYYSLAGAEFTVYTDKDCKKPLKSADGNNVVMKTSKTSEGTYETSKFNLPGHADGSKINYYVKETKAPKGYKLDNKVYSFSGTEGITFTIKNLAKKGKIEITKTDSETNLPLQGAEYSVYKAEEDAKQMKNSLREFSTNTDGKISRVIPADTTLYLRETAAPSGYILDNTIYKIKVKDGETSSLQLTNDKKQEITSGKAKIKKSVGSNEHIINALPEVYNLENAVYTIYTDPECETAIGSVKTSSQKTDANGKLYAESNELELEAGKYYIKETKAPMGYSINNTIYPVEINTGETKVINVKDDPEFNSLTLKLKKHIPDGKNWTEQYLSNAEYTVKYYSGLYPTEAELKDKKPLYTWVFKTDEHGEIYLKDNWKIRGDDLFKTENGDTVGAFGTYTFEETKAPNGFIKNDGITIRTLEQGIEPTPIDNGNYGDSNNVAAEKVLDATRRQIVISKKIHIDDVYKPYGTPTAIIKLEGTDIYGNQKTYYKSLTLDESTLHGDYYYAEAKFENLPAGKYYASEFKTSRYKMKDIQVINGNARVEGNKVYINLINSTRVVLSFENEISRWNDFSDMECIVNKF